MNQPSFSVPNSIVSILLRAIKHQFGYRKTRYRNLKTNMAQAIPAIGFEKYLHNE